MGDIRWGWEHPLYSEKFFVEDEKTFLKKRYCGLKKYFCLVLLVVTDLWKNSVLEISKITCASVAVCLQYT